MTEAQFTRQVLQLFRLTGWRTFHARPARMKRGWRTAVSGSGVGFLDILAIKERRLLVVELKVGRNRTTPAQDAWLDAFTAAGVETFLWTPDDWLEIERILKGG